jgi:hypothetical protein
MRMGNVEELSEEYYHVRTGELHVTDGRDFSREDGFEYQLAGHACKRGFKSYGMLLNRIRHLQQRIESIH